MYSQCSIDKRGFTLIELVIAIAIVGILAAIAFPFYNQHAMKAKRADAMQAMMSAAAAFERYKSANNFVYTGACTTADAGDADCVNQIFNGNVPADGGTVNYQITSDVPAGGRTFTLTATPQGGQATHDGALTLTNTGVRTWTNKQGAVNNCWPRGGNAC